jgi:Ni/Fe-hydrogenase subunit HybB-like protein
MLYSTVLTLEFAPVLLERLKWTRALKVVKAVVVPLVGLGFLLSTLHQSSLGSLYLILPSKLHPLWYSPLLPLHFWLTALSVGLAMIIFESGLSSRAFGHALQLDLLQSISKAMAGFLLVALGVRFGDLAVRGSLWHAFAFGTSEAGMFWLEIALFAAGMTMALSERIRRSPQALFGCSVCVVGGFLVNRLNVSLTALEQAARVRYMPSFYEVAVTASIVALGFVIFSLAARYLPVFHPAKEPEPEVHA